MDGRTGKNGGEEGGGFAIGRRIYDKQEIEGDEKANERQSKFMDTKYNLRDAKEDYNLWDNVYGKDVIKSLENSQKWEPGKRERERRLRRAMLEGGGKGTDEFDEQEEDDEAAKFQEDLDYCLEKTHFTEKIIREWRKSFMEECPNGTLTKVHLHRLFKQVFPVGDSEAFCNHIFRVFDDDGNNTLDFKEFLMALDVTQCSSDREKAAVGIPALWRWFVWND